MFADAEKILRGGSPYGQKRQKFGIRILVFWVCIASTESVVFSDTFFQFKGEPLELCFMEPSP